MSEKTGRVRRWNGCTCSDGYRCNVNCPCGAPTKSGVCVCFSVSRLTSERDEAVRKLEFAGIPESWFEPHQTPDGEYEEPAPGNFCGHQPRCQTIWEHCNATLKFKHDEMTEAVRVAGELRAKADLADRMWALLAARYQETGAMFIDEITDWLACYDSLTASTGGSSDEPQKEIRE